MSNPLLNKITSGLGVQELGWIIKDSIETNELMKLAKETGILDPDTTSEFDDEKIITDLAHELANKGEIAEKILAILETNNMNLMIENHNNDVQSLRDRINNLSLYNDSDKPGILFWSLLTDPRKEAYILHRAFIRQYRMIINRANYAERENRYNQEPRSHGGYRQQPNYRSSQPLSQPSDRQFRESNWNSQSYYSNQSYVNQPSRGEPRGSVQVSRIQEELKKTKDELKKQQKDFARLYIENESLRKEREELKKKVEDAEHQSGPSPYVESLAQQFLVFQERLTNIENMIYAKLNHVTEILEPIQRSLNSSQATGGLYADHGAHRRVTIGENSRVGIFVDAQNMFYAAKNQYNARLDYAKLLDAAVQNRRLIKAVVYLVQTPDVDQSAFVAMLQHKNYEVKTKDLRLRIDGSAKGDWDMGMAIDMISLANQLDIVVLVSGDGDFVSLVNLIKSKGPKVEVFGFPYNTSVDLKEAADEFFPINEDMLLDYSTIGGANGYHSEPSRNYQRSTFSTSRPVNYQPSELDFSNIEEEDEPNSEQDTPIDYSIFDEEGKA